MTTNHEAWGLRRVLNAYDKATPLGGARVDPAVAAAVNGVLPEAVEMERLLAAAGRAIARFARCEDGTVTHCAAAAITLNVAACMTGSNLESIARLPAAHGLARRVIIQKGHAISFGAPVTQMIRLSGAEVVEVGELGGCTERALAAALEGGGVAAVVAVESYHTVDYPGVCLPELAALCRRAGVPLVVDAATQELRLPEIMDMGPDLVGCSAHKYFESLTAGVVAGRRDLVQAVALQQRGIGRGMKPTKESVVALLASLERLGQRDLDAWQAEERKKIATLEQALDQLPGVATAWSPDPNGCPLWRLRLSFDPALCGWNASLLRTALQAPGQDPAVFVRIYGGEPEAVYLNATELTAAESLQVGRRLRALLTSRPPRTCS